MSVSNTTLKASIVSGLTTPESSEKSKAIIKKTTCPYCGVGCGVDALLSTGTHTKTQTTQYIESVVGSQNHPANLGRLCVKGSALNLTTESKHRLLSPRNKSGDIDWDTALETVATCFQKTIAEHGPDSVAFYLSGQLLTEDYYVANKLMKGFIGSANIDTNSRLCMASAVVGYKRAFGADTVPCSYEDLEFADLIVLIGSNAAWTHPVLYQRIASAKQKRPEMKIVLIDPRKTASLDIVDLYLPINAAADGFLFNGLLHYLIENEYIDNDYIQDNTNGFYTAKSNVSHLDLQATATATGIQIEDLVTFFKWFADSDKAISFYSQGINQSSTGSDKCNAIINCHLATAKIGKPGAGPFSITGQPNAMGGREVGGLANQLAAHMDFAADDIDRVQRFWQSPTIASQPGMKAVDLFDAMHEGKIKAVWVMATNPAVSLPNSEHVRKALEKCDFVVVSDYVENDTSHYADIAMPATSWGEKEGTVTNSERCISRQRPLRESVGQARHDWWQLSQVASRMGFGEYFDYNSPADIFREHAALSGFEQEQRLRDFDISALSAITDEEYENLTPTQWPINTENPKGTKRMFEDGLFFTENRKANFLVNKPRLNASSISVETPLLLNTGRIRDQWHTMTRTGTTANLLNHIDSPFIDVHPDDIQRYKLEPGKLARLNNEYGEFIAKVIRNDSVQIGDVFAPIHWTNQFAYKAIVSAVIAPNSDPYSGQPESKATPVSIKMLDAQRWAILALHSDLSGDFEKLLTNKLKDEEVLYWCKAPIGKHSQHECFFLALNEVFEWDSSLLEITKQHSQLQAIRFADEMNHDQRIALIEDECVKLIMYSHQQQDKLPSKMWLGEFMDEAVPDSPYRLILGESQPADKIICSCFQISENRIQQAIEDNCDSIEKLGDKLKCGANCGSCIPELKVLLQKI